MAESNRQSSSSRKRKNPGEQEPPIVQLCSAELCGCPECWKKAVLRPLFRRSARLAGKKPVEQEAKPRDHGRVDGKNAFVYDGCNLTYHIYWSSDCRYMYAFTPQADLLVVDLYRNIYKLWKTPTKWIHDFEIGVVIVNYHTILVATPYNRRFLGTGRLHVVRLPEDSDFYQQTLLHSTSTPDRESTFVLTEITGAEVDVKRAALGCGGELVFLRMDLDETRVTVQHTITHPKLRVLGAQMSKDGTRLYTVDNPHPKELHVYALDEQKWTEETLDDMEPNSHYFLSMSSDEHPVFATGQRWVNGVERMFLARGNFEARKWETIPLPLLPFSSSSPIVNPTDGKDEGLVCIVRPDFHCDRRWRIERRMIRNPDSLKLLSLFAFRKSRELVAGKESFHQKIDEAPLKAQLEKWAPVHFAGMKPIPVRRLE